MSNNQQENYLENAEKALKKANQIVEQLKLRYELSEELGNFDHLQQQVKNATRDIIKAKSGINNI